MAHKIVLNACDGGFDLSDYALGYLTAKGVIEADDCSFELKRDDPILVGLVERAIADGTVNKLENVLCELVVIGIPDDVKKWCISNLNGYETVEEVHREWRA